MPSYRIRLVTPGGHTETRTVEAEELTQPLLRRIVRELARRKSVKPEAIKIFKNGKEILIEF